MTISQERSVRAKVGLTLRRREQWGAVHDYSYPRSVSEPATRVFIHITITNPENYRSNDAHARAVEAIGRARFGRAQQNTGISYNVGIMPNAAAYEFQPMGRRGAHTVNDKRLSSCRTSGCPGRGGPLSAPSYNLNYNARSYVICQNVQHSVSDAMVDSLARCIAADKLAGLVTRSAQIHGHRCVSAKSCPGDRMWARMGELERRVDAYVKAGSVGGNAGPNEEDDDMPSIEEIEEAQYKATMRALRDAVAQGAERDTQFGRHFGFNLRDTLDNAGFDERVAHSVWSRKGSLDYVNDEPTSKAHQLSRAHQYAFDGVKISRRVEERQKAIAAALDGLDSDRIEALLEQHATESAARDQEFADRIEARIEALGGKVDNAVALLDDFESGRLDVDAFIARLGELFRPAESADES